MIAARLSSVWQVAGVAVAALCCYLVSQSVASERATLGKVDREIAGARADIAKLVTEISTRSRLTQLDSWNGTFGLKAPRPGQYVDSGVVLAGLYGRKGAPALQLDPAIASQQGSATVAAYKLPAPQPRIAPAQPAPAQSAPAQSAPDVIAPAAQPLLHTATFVRPKPSALAGDAGAPLVVHAAYHPAAEKPAALLPDDIGDLIAREEARDGAKKAGR